jgi:hypothetical protein
MAGQSQFAIGMRTRHGENGEQCNRREQTQPRDVAVIANKSISPFTWMRELTRRVHNILRRPFSKTWLPFRILKVSAFMNNNTRLHLHGSISRVMAFEGGSPCEQREH